MRRAAAVAAAAAALVLAGGVAYASIPGPDGVIHGCRKTSDGTVRIIDSAASCPSGYVALNWSQSGPQGPAGAAGPQGPAGLLGYQVVTVVAPVTVDFNPSYGAQVTMTADCPAGKVAVSGSGKVSKDAFDSSYPKAPSGAVIDSRPTAAGGWSVTWGSGPSGWPENGALTGNLAIVCVSNS